MQKIVFSIIAFVFTLFAQSYPSNSAEELVAVGISGAKITPGTYRVSPDQRVLDVIKMANGGKIPSLDTVDCRHIILTKDNGKSDTVDLLSYLNTGDLTQNPYVTGGQSIRLRFATEWVYISGDIQGVLTNKIPLKKNETAGSLLSLYTPNATADLDHILVERIGQAPKEYSVAELHKLKLTNLDAISIFPVKDRHDLYRVTVIGEVKRPGIYSIEQGQTEAQVLLDRTGGATDLGAIDEAWLVRKGKMALLPENQLAKGMESLNKEVTNSATNGIASGDFLIFPLKNGRITLEDGDEIFIPKKETLVYLSGQVKHPGGYHFEKDKDYKYYIELAGGFTRSADKRGVKVVETYGDVYRTVDNTVVSAGNLIMVPENDKERKTRFVLGVVTSVASVLTSAVTLAAFAQNQVK